MSAKDRENNEGVNQLARVFQERMQGISSKPPDLEFGVIQDDYSLLTNKYPIPIPQTDYFVCRHLTYGDTEDVLTVTQSQGRSGPYEHGIDEFGHKGLSGAPADGTHDHPPCAAMGCTGQTQNGQHQHEVLIPERMRWIKPGDHVLVAWVDADPVVIDLILPATEVG